MNLLRLNSALAIAVICLGPGSQTTNAQEADYACFMTTQTGHVMDLSESICGLNEKSAPAGLATSDKKFIADYKRYAMQYPDVRDNLLASAQQSPEPSITQAKGVCDELRAGLSLEEIKDNQSVEMLEKTELVNANIINTLAPKYYCPELNNQ